MTNYNELRDGQELYGNSYKKGYEDALNDYSNWLKKQTFGFDYNQCWVLVDRYYFSKWFITKMLCDLRDWRKE